MSGVFNTREAVHGCKSMQPRRCRDLRGASNVSRISSG